MFKNLNIHTIFQKKNFRNNLISIFKKHGEFKCKIPFINVHSFTVSTVISSIYFFVVFSLLTIKFPIFSNVRQFLNLDFLIHLNSPTFIIFSFSFGLFFTLSSLILFIAKYSFFQHMLDKYLTFLSKPDNFIPLLSNEIFTSHSPFYQANIVRSLISKQLSLSDIDTLSTYYQNLFDNNTSQESMSEETILNTIEELKHKINAESFSISHLENSDDNTLEQNHTNSKIKFFNSNKNN